MTNLSSIYCSRPETWNLDRAKAPRIADHKSPYIVNILRLMIDDPRELIAQVQIQVSGRLQYNLGISAQNFFGHLRIANNRKHPMVEMLG